MAKILLVDDDPQALSSTQKILELSGFEVVTAIDGQAALDAIRNPGVKTTARFDVVLSDVRMPRLGGLEFLRALSLCGESTPVILMTAFGRIEDAVWAMKLGAVDFLTKPFKRQPLLTAVNSALKRSRGRPAPEALKEIPAGDLSGLLIGNSVYIENLKSMICQIAPTAATVLITGESGTGKELVAKCIHLQSARSKRPFVALNCAAVPEQLIESELFGFDRGAFTGASIAKEGLFETAHTGTLLLDEIGDMPLPLQAKLLRVLQEGEIRHLGSTVPKKVDVRVIAATHRDLKEAVRAGTFRQDLLFRLEVIGVHLAPLRERAEDVSILAFHLLKKVSERHNKLLSRISEEAMAILTAYPWPGNVRELSNVVERAAVFAQADEMRPEDLPTHVVEIANNEIPKTFGPNISVPLGTSLKDVEEILIRKTLEATSGDKNMTAKLLGINSRTIYRKLDKSSGST